MWKGDVEAEPSDTGRDWNVSVQIPKVGLKRKPGIDGVFALDNAEEEEAHRKGAALDKAAKLTAEGVRLMEAGKAEAAVKQFDQAVFYAPQHAELHEMRAQALDVLGRSWDAAQAAHAAHDLRPEWPEALATLARCQANMGELSFAIASAQLALEHGMAGEELAGELAAWESLLVRQRDDPAMAGQRVPVVAPALAE